MVAQYTFFPARRAILPLLTAAIIALSPVLCGGQNILSANAPLPQTGADVKPPAQNVKEDPAEQSSTPASELEQRPVGGDPEKTKDRRTLADARRTGLSSPWRTLGSLFIVLALIIGTGYVFRRFVFGTAGRSLPAGIEILARSPINPKQSLCLVKLGGRVLLLGLSPTQMTALHTIEDPQEVAQVVGQLEKHKPHSISKTFDRLIRGQEQYYRQGTDLPAEGDDLSESPAQPWYQAKGELSSLLDKVKGLARMRFRP